MVERIGYPEFILNDEELDNMYRGVGAPYSFMSRRRYHVLEVWGLGLRVKYVKPIRKHHVQPVS